MSALYFEDYTEGWVFETERRTITDYDISAFVNLHGFYSPTFLDLEYANTSDDYAGRIAPGLLTFCMAEGLILQSGLTRKRGIFLMALTPVFLAPVRAGDTIFNRVSFKSKTPTGKPDRGVVVTDHEVLTTRGAVAIRYTSTRMIRTRAFIDDSRAR